TKLPLLAPDLILSVHIPKTGGITLFNLLEQRFGKGLLTDYPDRQEMEGRTDLVEAIHGHFEIADYLKQSPDARIITFLREPLDRALSHYYYWLTPPAHVPKNDPVYIKYFVEQKPDIEKFLMARELCNICTSFLYPLDHPEQFWFMGFQETFSEDIVRLQEMLSMPVKKQPILNPGRPRPKLDIPKNVIDEFYKLNWRDKAFYDLMFSKFKGSDAEDHRNIPVMKYELKRLHLDYATLELSYNKLHEKYHRIQSSSSWKLTKPLRSLVQYFRCWKK
ncbi:MAG: hypothetical protein ACE5DY_09205, partial [Mariprofundaceae bacterium]